MRHKGLPNPQFTQAANIEEDISPSVWFGKLCQVIKH